MKEKKNFWLISLNFSIQSIIFNIFTCLLYSINLKYLLAVTANFGGVFVVFLNKF